MPLLSLDIALLVIEHTDDRKVLFAYFAYISDVSATEDLDILAVLKKRSVMTCG